MAVGGHAFVRAAQQQSGHVSGAEASFGAPGGAQNLFCGEEGLFLGQSFRFAQADIASPATFIALRPPVGRIRGVEMGGQQAVPADRGNGVAADVAQLLIQRPRAFGRKRPVLFGQGPVRGQVRGREQQRAIRRQAVPAGAARLLLVMLHGARRVGVDHEAHVGAVDAHAEGDGGHDHVQPFVHEVVLGATPFFRVQAGVVGGAGQAFLFQARRQPVHVLAGLGIDDAALSGMAADDFEHLFELIPAREGPEDQVGPVGVADEDRGGAQAQLVENVPLHGGCRRRRQGHAGRLGKVVHGRGQAAVFRAEVVSPVRDAVGFIDGGQEDAPGQLFV